MIEIPRGETCEGVNRLILNSLVNRYRRDVDLTILDVPCGRGEFLDVIRQTFPNSRRFGSDIANRCHSLQHFFEMDANNPTLSNGGERFEVVTCISGVMEFANTLLFFQDVRLAMIESGVLYVSNDNLLTVRDRLLYLFAGRFGQYPFSLAPDGSTWKILPIQNLIRILRDAGFEIESLDFVPVNARNWLWLPIALPLTFFARLVTQVREPFLPIVSLRALISRHYVLTCRPI